MNTLKKIMLQPWIYLIIVLVGVFLKFYKIDYRYFWFDEVATIMHTSGNNDLFNLPVNEMKNITYYQGLLRLNERNISITTQLKGISNSINLNPLHYTLLVFWHRLAGDKDVSYRYFNVFIFILTLPFLYKLTRLLFNSSIAGWMAISLFSVNSYFQYYTFEARYTILCAFLIIFNQYAFLNAIKGNKLTWWIGYAISGIFCWYSSLNLGLIFMGHFIFVILFERRICIPYLIASFFIFMACLPWLISVLNHFDEISMALAWHGWFGNQNFFTLILAQLYFASYAFIILNGFLNQTAIFTGWQLQGNYIQFIFILFVAALLIYSVFFSYKKASKRVMLFILIMVLLQSLFFLISDLIRNTGISLIPRYNILIIIGFMLFLVFLFYEKIKTGSLGFVIIFIGLTICSILSIFYMADKDVVGLFKKDIKNASFLSGYEKPLLISDMNTVYISGSVPGILAFLNACNSDKADILLVTPDIKNITDYYNADEYSQIFILHGSQKLIDNLKIQLGSKLDSLEFKDMINEWQIIQ